MSYRIQLLQFIYIDMTRLLLQDVHYVVIHGLFIYIYIHYFVHLSINFHFFLQTIIYKQGHVLRQTRTFGVSYHRNTKYKKSFLSNSPTYSAGSSNTVLQKDTNSSWPKRKRYVYIYVCVCVCVCLYHVTKMTAQI